MTAQGRELSVTEENNSYKNPQRETQGMPSHVKTKHKNIFHQHSFGRNLAVAGAGEKSQFFTLLRKT